MDQPQTKEEWMKLSVRIAHGEASPEEINFTIAAMLNDLFDLADKVKLTHDFLLRMVEEGEGVSTDNRNSKP